MASFIKGQRVRLTAAGKKMSYLRGKEGVVVKPPTARNKNSVHVRLLDGRAEGKYFPQTFWEPIPDPATPTEG